jgi:hypothetical protein
VLAAGDGGAACAANAGSHPQPSSTPSTARPPLPSPGPTALQVRGWDGSSPVSPGRARAHTLATPSLGGWRSAAGKPGALAASTPSASLRNVTDRRGRAGSGASAVVAPADHRGGASTSAAAAADGLHGFLNRYVGSQRPARPAFAAAAPQSP